MPRLSVKPGAKADLGEAFENALPEDSQFLEKYVLAEDRLKLTAEFFDDDTEEYWYYSLLTLQNRFGKSDDPQLNQWLAKIKESDFAGSKKMQNLLLRQQIKDFGSANQKEVTKKLTKICKPKMGGKRETLAVEGDYPSTLQLTTKKLLTESYKNAHSRGRNLTSIFTPAASEFLAGKDLSTEEIGNLLDLLDTEAPELPYLLSLISKDLDAGTRFGDRSIHFKLTRNQLALVAEKKSRMLQDETFLITLLSKLKAVSDVDLRNDRSALGKYLDEMCKFAQKKMGSDSHQSLKALVLFNWMIFQEGEGMYDKDVFKQYLSIPKPTAVYNAEQVSKKLSNSKSASASFSYGVTKIPELNPIVDDERFVRRALEHFFRSGDKAGAFTAVDTTFGLTLWAEIMLLEGRGNDKFKKAQEDQLISVFGRKYIKKLNSRVVLELKPNNRDKHMVAENVELRIWSKNNPEIVVNVYEVQGKNWYTEKSREVPADINLFGATPIASFTETYEDLSILQKERVIKIPQLTDMRGVFVVDLIGKDNSTRAFIRKGELRFLSDQSPDGYVFTLFTEANEKIQNGCVWMDGVDYFADEKGEILIPFAPAEDIDNQIIVIEDLDQRGSAALLDFPRRAKSWRFESGIYIDRETLLEKKQAQVVIRPNLFLNATPVSVKTLEKPQLLVTTVNFEGTEITHVEQIELSDVTEYCYQCTVPTELRKVRVVLRGSIDGKTLTNESTISVNTIDNTTSVADMHLFPSGAAGYVLSVQGKNGEPFADQIVDVKISHRYFVDKLEYTAQTDGNGRIYLGRLVDVTGVDAYSKNTNQIYPAKSFNLLSDKVNVPMIVAAKTDALVQIPFTSASRNGPKVQIYDSNFIEDMSKRASYRQGYIQIKGLPAGDFRVFIRDMQNAEVQVLVSGGSDYSTRFRDYVMSSSRILGLSEEVPLQITSVKGSRGKGYRVQLQGFNERTRVHVLACSNVPQFNLYAFLIAPYNYPSVFDFVDGKCEYLAQRLTDEEYQYVLGRRDAEKYLTNSLTRPTLLTSKYAPAPTQCRPPSETPPEQPIAPPGRFVRRFKDALTLYSGIALTHEDSANLEFLGDTSRVYVNVDINPEGVVEIPSELYTDQHRLIQILAADDDNTALRNVIMEEPDSEVKFTDVRLSPGLEPNKHFRESRRVLPMPVDGDTYDIGNFLQAEYEPYDNLYEVFDFFYAFAAESGSAELKASLAKYYGLVDWHKLSMDQRLSLYDQTCCNEVNLFMYLKDKEFFNTVVKPLLENKMTKGFMDWYLLGRGDKLAQYSRCDLYARLNAIEKIYLAQVLKDDALREATLKTFQEQADLVPLNPKDDDLIFDLALRSRQLSLELRVELDKSPEADTGAADTGAADTTIQAPDALRGDSGRVDGPMDMTKEYQETQYANVAHANTNGDVCKINRFWNEYAQHILNDKQSAFLSQFIGHASLNCGLNEMLLAVAITDIPFEAEEPMLKYTGSNSVKLISHDPNILFIREIVPAEVRTSALSVHSNYFDPAEPTELVFGETVDKFQTGDFLTAKMYGVRTVVTNVSSCDYEVEVLAQIPQGSIPVNNGFRTRSWRVTLPPFGTFVKEYYFYFPSVGEYTHLPVHINKNGFTIGYHLETRNLNAVEKIEVADKSSWAYLSRDGTDDEVLDFLANSPQARSVNLKKIMWRLSDPKFFDDITRVLKDRQMYNTQIWSYSLVADRGGKELGEYLSQNKKFAGEFGPAFNSDLVTYDPFTQRQVCVMDMMPMVNPRSNGNTADASQNYKDAYVALLTRLAFTSSSRKSIGVIDQMNLAYFLASLGRLSTAKMVFSEIDKKAAREASRLSYDYLACYLAFFEKDPAGLKQARGISDQYKDEATLPLSKRTLFQAISEQLDEIKASAKGDPVFQKAAIEEETRLKTVPFLDFNATPDHKIVVDFRNLDTLEINFYLVDIEFQFSQQPFRDEAENYKFVNPNLSKTVKPGNKNPYAFSKPPALKGQNSVVEIIGKRGDKVMSVCAKPDQDNELMVETSKDCGQIRVLSMKKKAPISGAYCKVYGRVQGSQESIFYKDGYTDLRGRFDYVSVSSDVVSDVDCLAVLVMTEANGATVMEIGDLGVERSSLGLGAPKQA